MKEQKDAETTRDSRVKYVHMVDSVVIYFNDLLVPTSTCSTRFVVERENSERKEKKRKLYLVGSKIKNNHGSETNKMKGKRPHIKNSRFPYLILDKNSVMW